MSSLEFHEFVLTVLIKLFSIKNIISSKSPTEIFVSTKFLKYVKLVQDKNKIHTFDSNLNNEKSFLTNKIELRFNILSKPCTFYISKKNYSSLKKIYENFFCKINNLWLDKKTSKEIILLVEFNTSAYEEMIRTLSKSKKQVVVLNRRRSAIWNKNSIGILKSNNVKILDPEKFFDLHTDQEFALEHKRLNENLHELWKSKELFSIFSMKEISFWPLIKDRLKKIYDYRLDDYLKFIFQSRNFLTQLNIKKIICLGESGETENVLLQSVENDVDSILLQHSFLRYNPELKKLQWKYEDQNMLGLTCKNFFLWGNSDLNYFLENSKIQKDQLIISGSPRHDQFLQIRSSTNSHIVKNILVTLSPISERSGLGDTNLIIKYNYFLEKIFKILNEFNDLKITVKLHPGENPHNSILIDFLKNQSNITVFQIKNPNELIKKSDLMINISPELYDSSTIMLEGLLLRKPVIQLSLDDELSKVEPLKSPIIQISEIEHFEQVISKIINDEIYRKEIIEQISNKLNDYLSFQGNSSAKFLEITEKI
jgi:UDP-N-acetylglucosamine 2-epimerase